MNINIVVRIRNVEYRRESRQPHGVAPTLNKAMGQALLRTSFAGMTVWGYRQLINRVCIRYEKAIYGIKNIRISGRKNGFCLETKFFNEKELICCRVLGIFVHLLSLRRTG